MAADATRAPRIRAAARRLLEGGLVAFPTETVYGLGADAENESALARLFALKGRPTDHPLIVHVSPEADIGYWSSALPTEALALAEAFWPGPLTLIVPRAARISSVVSGGQDSIGLRCPAHPVAQALLREFASLKPGGDGGLAAPSANRFGHVSPTRAAHVRAEFPDVPESELMILDGGPSEVGIESTIVDLSRLRQGMGPVLLRPGAILPEQMAAVLGREVQKPDSGAPRASGSLKAHYSPRTPLVLVEGPRLADFVARKAVSGLKLGVLAWRTPGGTDAAVWHPAATTPQAYAHELYGWLRRMDGENLDLIVFERPPDDSAWLAVNDRLRRAAAAFDIG